MVVDQVRSGRRVAEVAAALGLPDSTVFRWVRQERMDRGELAGSPAAESAELRAAGRRIGELEALDVVAPGRRRRRAGGKGVKVMATPDAPSISHDANGWCGWCEEAAPRPTCAMRATTPSARLPSPPRQA